MRPLLIYRETCRRCRFIAMALVLSSCGVLRRVPMGSLQAARLCREYGLPQGKLALVIGPVAFARRAVKSARPLGAAQLPSSPPPSRAAAPGPRSITLAPMLRTVTLIQSCGARALGVLAAGWISVRLRRVLHGPRHNDA